MELFELKRIGGGFKKDTKLYFMAEDGFHNFAISYASIKPTFANENFT